MVTRTKKRPDHSVFGSPDDYRYGTPNAQDDPLVHLARQMLNTTGKLSDTDLNSFGQNSPIVQQMLAMGYKQNPTRGKISSTMSDRQALGDSIGYLRQGYQLGKGPESSNFGLTVSDPGLTSGPGGAASNLVNSLVAERVNNGMSLEDARADIAGNLLGTVQAEHQVINTPDNGGKSTLSPQQQAEFTAKKLGLVPAANTTYKQNEAQGFATKNLGKVADLVKHGEMPKPEDFARNQAIEGYMQRGAGDIGSYNQTANIFGGLVPTELQPLYQYFVAQRGQTMLKNLAQWKDKVEALPGIQKLQNRASDLGHQANGANGSGNKLETLLRASGISGGGLGGATPGSGSKDALSKLALSRQITNTLNLAKYMGNQFTNWENPVISRNQVGMLNNFLPHSAAAGKKISPIADYFMQNMFAPPTSPGY